MRTLPGKQKRDPRGAHRRLPVETALLFQYRTRVGIGELLGRKLQLLRQRIGAARDNGQSRVIGRREAYGAGSGKCRRGIGQGPFELGRHFARRRRANAINATIGRRRGRRNGSRRYVRGRPLLSRGRSSGLGGGDPFAPLEQNVVRLTFARRTYRGQTSTVARGVTDGHGLGSCLNRAGVLSDKRQRRFESERGRHLARLNFEGGLDQRRHRRSTGGVADLANNAA